MVHTQLQLINDLRTGVLEIIYRMPDNTVATLRGTLNPEFIPEKARKYIESNMNNPDILSPDNVLVWDMGSSVWRTLRVDRVEEAQFTVSA